MFWFRDYPQLARIETRQTYTNELLVSLMRMVNHMDQHLIDTQASLAALVAKVDLLIGFYTNVQTAAATETDLDALKATIDAEAAKVAAVLPPTP